MYVILTWLTTLQESTESRIVLHDDLEMVKSMIAWQYSILDGSFESDQYNGHTIGEIIWQCIMADRYDIPRLLKASFRDFKIFTGSLDCTFRMRDGIEQELQDDFFDGVQQLYNVGGASKDLQQFRAAAIPVITRMYFWQRLRVEDKDVIQGIPALAQDVAEALISTFGITRTEPLELKWKRPGARYCTHCSYAAGAGECSMCQRCGGILKKAN
jgi:hypothetical protein